MDEWEFDIFEASFQAWIRLGGHLETRCVSQEYEVMRRALLCVHGEVRSNCPSCRPMAATPNLKDYNPYGR